MILVGNFATSHAQDIDSEHTVTVFPNQDSLYVYVPAGIPDGYTIDLASLCFEAVGVEQRCLGDFDNFRLPIASLSAPICFEFVRDGTTPAIPFECNRLPDEQLYSERVIAANMFWYDLQSRSGKAMNISLNGDVLQTCPGSANRCDVVVQLEERGTTVTIATNTSIAPVIATTTEPPSATPPPSATASIESVASPTPEATTSTPTETPSPTPTEAPVASAEENGSDDEESESDLDKATKIAQSITIIVGAILAVLGLIATFSERFRQVVVAALRLVNPKNASKGSPIKHEGLQQLSRSLNAVIIRIHAHSDGVTFRFEMEFVPTDSTASLVDIENQVRTKADALRLPTLSDLKVSQRPMTRKADRIRIEGYIVDRKG
jgi:hypothetical protein